MNCTSINIKLKFKDLKKTLIDVLEGVVVNSLISDKSNFGNNLTFKKFT